MNDVDDTDVAMAVSEAIQAFRAAFPPAHEVFAVGQESPEIWADRAGYSEARDWVLAKLLAWIQVLLFNPDEDRAARVKAFHSSLEEHAEKVLSIILQYQPDFTPPPPEQLNG
jgi:hypothetical protein